MPKVNGTRLSVLQVRLMRLLASTQTNESIAHTLGLPLGSYHVEKKKLYGILAVQTKQEVALLCRDLGLV
jgi:hypothetical protein